jgi:hypothetical protein
MGAQNQLPTNLYFLTKMWSKNFSKETVKYFFNFAVLASLSTCSSSNSVKVNPVNSTRSYTKSATPNQNPYYQAPQAQRPNYQQQYQAPPQQYYNYQQAYQPQSYQPQQQYQQPYAQPAASRFYSNPYAIPPTTQQNPRYDVDQYYVPPTNGQVEAISPESERAKSILENLSY